MSEDFDHFGDAYESAMREEEQDDYEVVRFSSPKIVSCKYCNRSGFTWTIRQSKWYMQDSRGELHLCRTKNAKAKTEALVFKKKNAPLSIDEINDLLIEAARLDKQDRLK